MDEYQFPCEPIANEESVVAGSHYRFTIINDKVLRYEWAEDGNFEDRASTFAINRKQPKPDFRVEETEDELVINTPSLRLVYDKKRFSPNGLVATFASKMNDWGSEWRYGEQQHENLGGTARTLDEVNGRCDMGNGILSKGGYSALDDTHSMLFDGKGFVTPRRPGDRIDGYLFFYGFDYRGAMECFYAISGRQPSVPRWCLGNWWSRYHAYSQDEYLALMDTFQDNGIPLSVAVIDMDWHWVKEDFVPHTGWTGYTWNKDLFPNHVRFAKTLHERGLKITLNDHPHSGIAKHEEIYGELASVLGHDTQYRDPIQFDPTSSKFMHAYFNVVHRKLEREGCDFWWIDWQQGSNSRTPGFDPLWLLNHFQYLDAKQNHKGSHSIIFSRYGGPGSHRYPVGFSGDTVATWESLKFQPEFTATASNIGYGWWSHDIGGHLPGYRDDECTARWVQYGVFSPILRLHSTVSRWMSKEPWLYHAESMLAMKNAMRLRHRLVPYVHSHNVAESSVPLVVPLYWRHPKVNQAYNYPNQYFFGDKLLVAPVVTPRNKLTGLAKTKAWLPPLRYVDIFTGTVYDGDRELTLYRPLNYIPVFAPEGSIIPLDLQHTPENGCYNPDSFEVIVVVGRDDEFTILEDKSDDKSSDGLTPAGINNPSRKITIAFDQAAGRLTSASSHRNWEFRFISVHVPKSQIRVLIGNDEISEWSSHIDHASSHQSTIVKVPAQHAYDYESLITVEIGPNPKLNVLDHNTVLHDMLIKFQIGFHIKDKIWDVVESKQPTSVKASRLLALDLDEALYGPIAELLFADSRHVNYFGMGVDL